MCNCRRIGLSGGGIPGRIPDIEAVELGLEHRQGRLKEGHGDRADENPDRTEGPDTAEDAQKGQERMELRLPVENDRLDDVVDGGDHPHAPHRQTGGDKGVLAKNSR